MCAVMGLTWPSAGVPKGRGIDAYDVCSRPGLCFSPSVSTHFVATLPACLPLVCPSVCTSPEWFCHHPAPRTPRGGVHSHVSATAALPQTHRPHTISLSRADARVSVSKHPLRLTTCPLLRSPPQGILLFQLCSHHNQTPAAEAECGQGSHRGLGRQWAGGTRVSLQEASTPAPRPRPQVPVLGLLAQPSQSHGAPLLTSGDSKCF